MPSASPASGQLRGSGGGVVDGVVTVFTVLGIGVVCGCRWCILCQCDVWAWAKELLGMTEVMVGGRGRRDCDDGS
jgi:hypothetical protein